MGGDGERGGQGVELREGKRNKGIECSRQEGKGRDWEHPLRLATTEPLSLLGTVSGGGVRGRSEVNLQKSHHG